MTSCKPKAIICDLDGTLCDHRHRLHHVERPEVYEIPCLCQPVNRVCEIHKNWKPDYEAFYAAMDEDAVNLWCAEILHHLSQQEEYEILFVTGRPEKYRDITDRWINTCHYGGFENRKLFMRLDSKVTRICPNSPDSACECSERADRADNLRSFLPCHIVKQEIYEREIKDKYDVLFVLEDSRDCVKMYRNLGLIVLDCGK